MLNKFRIGAASVAIVAAIGLAASANAKVTASATAEAVILPALTLDVQTGSTLNFGTIAPNGAGTVIVDPDPAASLTCSTNLICTGSYSPVGFDVTGGADQNVLVTIPAGSATLTESGGATIKVNTFPTDAANPLVLDSSGLASFHVGGKLVVASGQAAGSYSGTFNVSVAYQ